MLAVMGGTGLRMVFVVGAGMALFYLHPDFNHAAFWIWVIVFYLFTLTLEMVILLVRPAAPKQSANQ